jgi:hypothetical protein
MKKTLTLITLAGIAGSMSASAATIASYADGTTSAAAAYVNGTTSTIATVTALSSEGLDGLTTSTRSDGRAPTATETADALPGGIANNWISASAGSVAAGGGVSTTDYLELTATINEATTLASFSFQSVNGSGQSGNPLVTRGGGLVTTYSLFYSLNGAAYTQLGSSLSSAPWTGTAGTSGNGSNFLGPQSEITFDLSSIGALVATDTVALRLNLQDGSSIGPKTNFLNNIALETIPEPSVALLGCIGMLGLLRRRK